MNSGVPSIFLLAPLLGWLAAHLIKFLLTWLASGGKERSLGIFFKAGGMPSSHSAVMAAIVVAIGAREGVGSALFALAVTVAAVVLYDAVNVRRSVGEQGDVLRKIVAKDKGDHTFFTAYGHTLTEVLVGMAVGGAVSGILLQIL